jgi:DNA-binding response OmpR family regulator
MDPGMDDYISKPFKREVLAAWSGLDEPSVS